MAEIEEKGVILQKFNGSHERRLLNYSYICTVAENLWQSKQWKRLAFSSW